MDLYEYQARDLFEKHGVPVLPAAIATTADEAEAATIARRYSRRSPSNRRVNRRWADLDARRNRRSYSPSTFHGRLFSRYQNYCRGSRTGRKVHICLVIDALERKLANSEINMKDVDRDLETMLSDIGN